MVKLELTNKAVEDLTNIWEYTTEERSEHKTDKYYHLLLSKCQEIANNPESGKIFDGITNDLFGIKVEKHIIFYRKRINKPIEITRILQIQIDLKNKLSE